ncbi:MAG TPA: endonuclease MutS2 [Clostridiales bacterium]|nr:endonuclease MutS2 [Clostridiales bacterium]
MNKHYKSLELDKILTRLASFCTVDEAKEAALKIEPSVELRTVKILLKQTADVHTLLARYSAPSFGGIKNINNALSRAEAGSTLTTRELLDVAENLRVIRSLNEWRSNMENADTASIDFLFNALIPNRFLEESISEAILNEDEISDSASPTLRDIRRNIAMQASSIRQKLDKIIRSEYYKKYLQDAIVTQRNGRFVVPVKSEHRSVVPGLVHDTSSSGATVFIEPMAVVEANNEIKILQNKERDEIERILAALSYEVGLCRESLKNAYDAAVSLNVIFAKGKMAFDMKASIPEVNDEGIIDIINARHPLLNQQTVVPTSINLGKDFDTLVITGPNTGGKTVSIKTIGLLTLMAMCGFMIPVSQGSVISVFKKVFADIGDEQSIEQSLSTFSSHMTNIVDILKNADEKSLVLIDELGAGTDPVEGAALAMAILEQLHIQGAKIAATTHYAELKAYALNTPGVENGCCEFDIATLKPTYRLLIGIPGKSNAFAISERLGMEKEVVNRARRMVEQGNVRFEEVVDKLEERRREMEDAQKVAVDAKKAALEDREKARLLRQTQEEKVNAEIQKARDTAAKIVEETRRQANILMDEISALRKEKNESRDLTELARRAKAAMKSGVNNLTDVSDPVYNIEEDDDYVLPRELEKGDTVLIRSIGQKGTVLSPADNRGRVEVQSGAMKTRVDVSSLRLLEDEKKTKSNVQMKMQRDKSEAPKVQKRECDIRGMNADEGILEVDRFLDAIFMSNLDEFSIIHGKGTGVLRAAVQKYLKGNPRVKSYRLGVYGEGGDGITIVTVKREN